MKRWIVPGFLVLISCIPALAQPAPAPDPAKMALGREIYDLIQSSQNVAQRMQAIAAAVARSMPQDDKARAGMNAGMSAVSQSIEDLRPKIREAWATAVSSRFTLSEMQSIKDFYTSPAGSKFITEQPEISKEMLTTIMPELMARMQTQIAPAPEKEKQQ